MKSRLLSHRELSKEYSNGALAEALVYYLPNPRRGDTMVVFLDAPYDIHFDTNDPNVPILSNHPPSQRYTLEGKEENLGNSIILKCLGSAWRVIPRFF